MACLVGVAAIPLARGGDTFREVAVRSVAVAFVAMIAAVVLGWSPLVPFAVGLVGGTYAAELAIDDAPLDLSAPAVSVGLLLAAELAYWSLDELRTAPGDRGQGLRRAALVLAGCLVTFVLGSALLAVVGEVHAGGFTFDLIGALAAVAIVVAALVARQRTGESGRPSSNM